MYHCVFSIHSNFRIHSSPLYQSFWEEIMDFYVVTHNYQSSLLFVLYLFIYSCFFSSCMRIENVIKKKLHWDNFILLRSKNPIWYTMFLKRNNYSWQNGSTVRTLSRKNVCAVCREFLFSLPQQLFTVHCQFQQRKGSCLTVIRSKSQFWSILYM